MDWMLLLGFVLMWLPLILLVLGRALGEENQPQREVESGTTTSFETASFFAKPRRRRERPAPSRTVEDQTVIRLEDYLRAENEEAERFISRPSIGSLYRNCGQGF